MIQDKPGFNQTVLRIIDQFSHPFYHIQLDESFKCICHTAGTSQPDPKCPRCLGTGYRIKIKKIEGAVQESGIPLTSKEASSFSMTSNYYISQKYNVRRKDLIVDGDEAFVIDAVKVYRSFGGQKIYSKVSAVPKKFDSDIFTTNFNKLIGGKS